MSQLNYKTYSYPLPLWLSYFNIQNSFDPKPDIHAHRHHYYEILFFKKAHKLKHYLDFTPYPVEAGSLFFVQPGQIHLIDSSLSDCRYELYVFTFSEDFLAQVITDPSYILPINDLFVSATRQASDRLASVLIDLWHQMQQELTSKETNYEKMSINLFRNLVILLKRQLITNEQHAIAKHRSLASFRAFQQLLETHFHQHWSVHQYAKALNMNTRQLHRVCMLITHLSPISLVHKRINIEAKRQLFYTHLPIKEIAYQLGFIDQAYFSRFFFRLNSESPEAFRIRMSQQYQ